MVVLSAGALGFSATHIDPEHFFEWLPWGRLRFLVGAPANDIRLFGIFLCGSLFHLYANKIEYNWKIAAVCSCVLIRLMFSAHLAELGVAVFGGYLLFWFAFNVKSPKLAAVGKRVDLSYGIYLYAWPVQKLLIWLEPGISPWLVFTDTIIITSLLALASWCLIEKPCLNLKPSFVPAMIPGGKVS